MDRAVFCRRGGLHLIPNPSFDHIIFHTEKENLHDQGAFDYICVHSDRC